MRTILSYCYMIILASNPWGAKVPKRFYYNLKAFRDIRRGGVGLCEMSNQDVDKG